MNSRDVVSRALAGLDVPRPATGPLAVHYCARWSGVSLREYTLNAEALAGSVIAYYERFQPDAVWLSADTWVTAQAMGAPLEFPDADQPLGGSGTFLVHSPEDVDRIPPPDTQTQSRYPLMLDALRRIKQALGDRAYIVTCFDQYPFSLACALMGLETVMLKVHEDRPFVERLLSRCVDYSVAYAWALAQAGADLLSGGDSPAGLLGPKLYRELALPYEQEVIRQIKARCAQPVSLHICGNATPILRDMQASGADVLELDHQTDMEQACRLLGPGIGIWGNLDPVGLLAQGTPEQVRAETQRVLQLMARLEHRRFVLSSGCTLAMETPPENLAAMLQTTA